MTLPAKRAALAYLQNRFEVSERRAAGMFSAWERAETWSATAAPDPTMRPPPHSPARAAVAMHHRAHSAAIHWISQLVGTVAMFKLCKTVELLMSHSTRGPLL
jgi:hypothetical protein